MQSITSICIRIIIAVCVSYSGGRALAQGDWVQTVANRSLPTVVNVTQLDCEGNPRASGSGYIVSSNGVIVTNYHVIQGGCQATVQLRDGDRYPVKGVIDFDREKDFAILKIAAFDLPVAQLGNSNQVQIAEAVVAIGNPQGLEGTVSTGIISAIRKVGAYSILQTTAPISPGSSGGPLLNRRGEVIGMLTMQLIEGQNLNFALPINYVRGSLNPDAAIKKSLKDLAKIEEQLEEEEFKKLFGVYEDPDRQFRLVVFKDWNVQRLTSWDKQSQTLHLVTIITPKEAKLAELNGYVSEGVRVHLLFPAKGKVWTARRLEDWPDEMAKELLMANPGFARTETHTLSINGIKARADSFVGQDLRLPEPEKTIFYTMATPEAMVTVELIAPTSKLNLLEALKGLIVTFELMPDPNGGSQPDVKRASKP